jgi:hypothetical protein
MVIGRNMRVTIIALTPALFWAAEMAVDFLRHDPEALEAPLLYLFATYVYWGPVFALTGILLIALLKLAPDGWLRSSWTMGFLGALVSLACLVGAHFAFRLPLQPWRFCLGVGAGIGVVLAPRHRPA